MKLSEVAKRLNLCKGTVKRYIKLGKLKAVLINTGKNKICNSWYVTEEQLEDYLKQYNVD